MIRLDCFDGKGQPTKKTWPLVTCARPNCTTQFYAKPGCPTRPQKRYCSYLCARHDREHQTRRPMSRSRRIERACVQCQRVFRDRNGHAKTCSIECAKKRKYACARKRESRCEWCNQWCNGRFCSGDCKHRHADSLKLKLNPLKDRQRQEAKYGPPIEGADIGAPRCHCGETLKLGSDPMTGRSLQWCPRHGESLVRVRRRTQPRPYRTS